MDVKEIDAYFLSLFHPETVRDDEYGVTVNGPGPVERIGYATNLTPDVIELAHREGADLIVTHHDCWNFIFGMKDVCDGLLAEYGISHIYAYLPLDYADFGTAGSLVETLGAAVVRKIARYEGFLCGRVGTLPEAYTIDGLADKLGKICNEKVRSWSNSDKTIRTVGVVPGAGVSNAYIKECVENGCDAFVTGETNLYNIEYARFAGIHLIVGSHTFTEIFGVRKLAEMLCEKYPGITAIRLHEEHIELSAL